MPCLVFAGCFIYILIWLLVLNGVSYGMARFGACDFDYTLTRQVHWETTIGNGEMNTYQRRDWRDREREKVSKREQRTHENNNKRSSGAWLALISILAAAMAHCVYSIVWRAEYACAHACVCLPTEHNHDQQRHAEYLAHRLCTHTKNCIF